MTVFCETSTNMPREQVLKCTAQYDMGLSMLKIEEKIYSMDISTNTVKLH